jgi:peptidoglycan/xylan/chitin deacetylase (PgdA/CDA1 family)
VVLTYHALGDVPPEQDPDGLVTPAAVFRAQVKSMVDRGYEFVTASEVARRVHAHRPLDGVAAVTLDDGSLDNYTILPDLLLELGVPATVFACPGLLGEPDPYLRSAGVRLMTAEELRAVADLGFIEIGSHTNEHADLTAASPELAYREMVSSKQALEDILERPVETFAYPFCRYSAACPAAAERAGYLAAFACDVHGSRHPYELRRSMMDRADGRLRFALKSHGVFERLVDSRAMHVVRRLRRRLRSGNGDCGCA